MLMTLTVSCFKAGEPCVLLHSPRSFHLHRNLKDFKNEAFVHLYTAIEVEVVVGLRYQQKCPERRNIHREGARMLPREITSSHNRMKPFIRL